MRFDAARLELHHPPADPDLSVHVHALDGARALFARPGDLHECDFAFRVFGDSFVAVVGLVTPCAAPSVRTSSALHEPRVSSAQQQNRINY